MKRLLHKIRKTYNSDIRKIPGFVWRVHPGMALLSGCLILLESASWVATLYTLKKLVEAAVRLQAGHTEVILPRLLATAGAAMLYAAVKNLTGYCNDRHAIMVNHAIDRQIHAHTLGLDLSYYDDPHYLDILKRAREAGTERPYAIVTGLTDVVRNGVMLLSVGYVLATIDWRLLPLLPLFVLPAFMVRIITGRRYYKWQRSTTGQERKAGYLSTLMTGDAAAKEVRAFLLGAWLQQGYTQLRDGLLHQSLKLKRGQMLAELATGLVSTLCFFAVTGYIIMDTAKGRTTMGDIAVFLVVFPQSFGVIHALMGAVSRLYQNSIYVIDIFELFGLKPAVITTPEDVDTIRMLHNGDVVISNLSFRYPHTEEPTLENISMKLPAGKIIALVGLNGAGKTTLIKLIARLYDPSAGTIRIAGTDVRQLPLPVYRRFISVVFQDFVRYNVTVAEAIHFGAINKPPDMDAIVEAATKAGAHGFISRLPQGYHTLLGRTFDDGCELSTGQWQLLAVARAFYSAAQLIVWDEATSALDARAEDNLFGSLRQRLGNRTALIISHRQSAVKHADYIYVMAGRHIAEEGTHEELMVLNGKYAAQFRSGIKSSHTAIT